MGINKHYGSIFGCSLISAIFSIWLIIAGSQWLSDEKNYYYVYKPDPEFIIVVGAEVLFASLLGFAASSKRTKGSRVCYNIFAGIGFGLSTAYFIWAIDIGFFAWIAFVLMLVLLTGLGNSGSISRKQKEHEYKANRGGREGGAVAQITITQQQQYQMPNAQYNPPQYQPMQPGQQPQYYQAPPLPQQQYQQVPQQQNYYPPPPPGQQPVPSQQQPMMGYPDLPPSYQN